MAGGQLKRPARETFLQESLYLDLLVDAKGFAISDSQLTITTSDDHSIVYAPERR